jgi:hypothetical protein
VRLWKSARWALAVALPPFAVLGLLTLGVRLYAWVRYEPAHFAPAAVERYQAAGAAAGMLEQALQGGDTALLAEVEGLRWPVRLPTGPDISLVMLWERNDRYSTYLYFDRATYQRYLYSFEYVRGRWVAAPPDLVLGMHTGGWRGAFLAAATAWWVLGTAALCAGWWFRRSARMRAWLLGS